MGKKKSVTLALLVAFVVCLFVVLLMLRSRPAQSKAGTESNTRALVSMVDNMTADDLNDALARFRDVSEEDIINISETMPRFTGERVKLVFTGTGSTEMMSALADVLEERNLTSSFFFTESELRTSQRAIETLLDHNIEIGLMYDNQGGSMAGASGEELVSSLCSLSFLLRAGYNLIRVPVMSRERPSLTALRAATACGYSEVVVTHSEISLDDCISVDVSRQLLFGVDRGDIVRVHLEGGNSETVVANLVALLDALAETNSRLKAQQRLGVWSTDWGLAYPIRRIDTTEEGAVFSFTGLGNQREVENVLQTLRAMRGKGLFYVTLDEAVHSRDTVRLVLADGHDIGIYVPDIDSPTAEEYLTEMISCEEEIQMQFGYSNELPVYVPYDQEFNLLKAASAGGFSLATAYLFPVRPQDTRKVDNEEEIMLDILSRFDRTVNRGELVHFDLNQFIYSDEMSAKLIQCFAEERCVYPLHSFHIMNNNEPKLWHYPLDDSLIISSVRNRIRRGQLRTSLMTEMTTHYIGSPLIATEEEMVEFEESEIRSIDKTGVIRNNRNEVYLTFNDADMDAFITPLLHVLKKHNAKATFFIRTETADWNVNLMRAIAEEGHALAIRADDTFNDVYAGVSSLSADDILRSREMAIRDLQSEFKTAYDTLVKIAGDIYLREGMPAITNFFRPPFTQINPVGMSAAFDSGFSWSIGGAYLNIDIIEPDPLTADEDAKPYNVYREDQLSEMLSATKSGAVISVSYVIDEEVDLVDLIDQYLTAASGYRFVPLSNILKQ